MVVRFSMGRMNSAAAHLFQSPVEASNDHQAEHSRRLTCSMGCSSGTLLTTRAEVAVFGTVGTRVRELQLQIWERTSLGPFVKTNATKKAGGLGIQPPSETRCLLLMLTLDQPLDQQALAQ